jgi:hypothetical protein
MTITKQQALAMIASLRHSTKQFYVNLRSGDSFRCRFSEARSPLPADDAENIVFYQWLQPGQPDGIRRVPVSDLVSLTMNGSDYTIED